MQGVSEKGSAVRLKEAILAENWTAALRSAINLCPDNETYNKVRIQDRIAPQKGYLDDRKSPVQTVTDQIYLLGLDNDFGFHACLSLRDLPIKELRCLSEGFQI